MTKSGQEAIYVVELICPILPNPSFAFFCKSVKMGSFPPGPTDQISTHIKEISSDLANFSVEATEEFVELCKRDSF